LKGEQMEIKEKVRETLINLLKLKPNELQDDVRLCDGIGVDSTEMVEVVIALEKAFGMKLIPKEITKFCSINDIEKIIQSKIAATAIK
jgi:acyl carrier protein